MSEKTVDELKTFTNKQVLSLVGSAIFITFVASGLYFKFNANDLKLDNLEKEHKVEMKSLRDEMKLMAKFFQSQFDTYKDDSKRRINTIRDRTDERLNQLERSNSDSQ